MTLIDDNNFKIPVIVEEQYGLSRNNEPIRIGVPFPKGFVTETDHLGLLNQNDQEHQCQKQVLEKWSDGSLKWVLLDFLADVIANSSSKFYIKKINTNIKHSFDKIILKETKDYINVTTGTADFLIDKQCEYLVLNILLSKQTIPIPITISITDIYDNELSFVVEQYNIDNHGPLRCSISLTGHFITPDDKHFLNVTFTCNFYSGCSFLVIDFVIHNPSAAKHPGGLWDMGDPGSIFFKDLSLHAKLPSSPNNLCWQTSSDETLQTARTNNWHLYQDSSGGKHWNSPNHVDHQNDLSVTFPGFRLNYYHNEQQTIIEGRRATPFLQAETDVFFLSGAIFEFWQNFPKAICFEEKSFHLSLFPKENKKLFELQGGEQKRHKLFFQVGLLEEQNIIPQFLSPLNVFVDPHWIAQTKTVPYLSVPDQKDDSTYLKYIENIIKGPNSFFQKREQIDEFGWRNFGDLYADHEAVNHQGPEPFISHYNNQYDFIYGACFHFIKTGDSRWWDLASPAARHLIDIDIYHTDQDRPAYNHGLFWHTDHYLQARTASHRTYSKINKNSSNYGGGTSNEHIYTSGLTLYFFLTGDTHAREAVLELANYVLDMDDGTKTIFGLIDEGPTGLASQTVDITYHKPGRGAGNCINCLIDAYRLSSYRRYLVKAEELIQRCIHPEDEIEALQLDDPEYRWSYLVFLQVLGKYLDYKSELGETDYSFSYARESLLHYADWMAEHELPFQNVLHKVLIPTETWPAHDIRKCHVFHLAAKYCPEGKRPKYAQKASHFYDRCLHDLLSYKTACLTRPLVILCVYGYVHDYFLDYGYGMITTQYCYDFGSPQTFQPQRLRFKSLFLNKLKNTVRIAFQILRDKIYQKKPTIK